MKTSNWKIDYVWKEDANKGEHQPGSEVVHAFDIYGALKEFDRRRPVNCRILGVTMVAQDPGDQE